MKIISFRGLVVLFLVTITPQAFAIPAEERAALIALYHSTNGDNWKFNRGWLGEPGTECNWARVRCSDNSIRELYLHENQLTGNIPPELGQLSQLAVLYLHTNQLTGSIPPELGQLSPLLTLNLDNNQLTGNIPPELGQLRQLGRLLLNANQLTGNIPPELGQLPWLSWLGLSNNQLTGNIPPELGEFSTLKGLTLDGNELTGTIPPELGQLSELLNLRLNKNCLTTNDAGLISFLDSIEKSTWRDQRTDCSTVAPTTDIPPEPTLATGSFAEPSDTPEQAIPILVNNGPQVHLLDKKDDEDWFKFYAEKGGSYTIEVLGDYIGSAIDPILSLFDNEGNLLETADNNSIGQGEVINWTATETGLFRFRVTNGAILSAGVSAATSYYRPNISRSDKPGSISGVVLNACHQTGVKGVSVSALLNGVSEGSSFTFDGGRFGIQVNPGTYDLKVQATGYQSSRQSVPVKSDNKSPVQFSLVPMEDCAKVPKPFIDPILLRQQAVSVYDDKNGLLIIKNVYSKGTVYLAKLKAQSKDQFLLVDAVQLPGTLHKKPASYNQETLLVDMPSTFMQGKLYSVQMKNNGDGLFTVTSVK